MDLESQQPENVLDFEIREIFTLHRFEIVAIRVFPRSSADIDVCFFATNKKIYTRTFTLTGEEYLAWTGDDYLFSYIQKNIAAIFYGRQEENEE